jgi:outer membrane protein
LRPRSLLLLLFIAPYSAAAQNTTTTLTLAQAIGLTLRQHPLLHIQEEQVRSNRGALLRAQSQFDRLIQANASSSHTYRPLTEVERPLFGGASVNATLSSLDASATQQFRNGISISPTVSITRTTDNLGAESGLNQSHVAFQVNLPLLRGRGKSVVAAQETATSIEIEASVFDLNQTISDLLFATVTSYWTAIASRLTRDVYRDAEERARTFLGTVQALIEADKIPRSDLNQVLANLQDRASSRAGAEQQLLEATQQFARATGTPAEEIVQALEATDPLPEALAVPEKDTKAVIDQALTRRADYLAARQRVNEAQVLSKAARNQLKSQLDVQLSIGYSGLREGTRPDQFLISPLQGVHGIDVTGGIHYQLPLQRRAAEGNILSADATVRQAELRGEDLARTIASAVVVALVGLRNASRQLTAARESVRQFNTALENERAKYRLGVGSLVDVLTVEDRLTGVMASQVQAELLYAIAIARLRQATGTVVEPDKTAQNIDAAIFLRP